MSDRNKAANANSRCRHHEDFQPVTRDAILIATLHCNSRYAYLAAEIAMQRNFGRLIHHRYRISCPNI